MDNLRYALRSFKNRSLTEFLRAVKTSLTLYITNDRLDHARAWSAGGPIEDDKKVSIARIISDDVPSLAHFRASAKDSRSFPPKKFAMAPGDFMVLLFLAFLPALTSAQVCIRKYISLTNQRALIFERTAPPSSSWAASTLSGTERGK